MSETRLKKSLQQYYFSKSLSTAQIDDLLNKKRLNVSLLAFSSAFACFFVVFIYFNFFQPFNMSVMKEIARNHSKNEQSLFYPQSFTEIQAKLPKLNFQVIASRKLDPSEWEVVGAKYCSIHGEIAAQLKIRNRSNSKIYTLYQSKDTGEITNESRSENIDGVDVKIWTENGLIMGLAGPEINF